MLVRSTACLDAGIVEVLPVATGAVVEAGVVTAFVAVGVAEPSDVDVAHPATRSAAQSAISASTASLSLLIPIQCD